jgi:hypothetical protein
MRSAIRGDVIRALVELVLNSDDSYIRMLDQGLTPARTIEIEYGKTGSVGKFAVRDHAEGMNLREVEKGFTEYGESTSGFSSGQSVRGFFGEGAKDALISMTDGKIVTFKDDQVIECRVFFNAEGEPAYELTGPDPVKYSDRKNHRVPGNGTVAYFSADPRKSQRVPLFSTVQEQLSNHYMLRVLMADPARQIFLKETSSAERRPLRYKLPQGREVRIEGFEDFNNFKIDYGDLGEFNIALRLYRADTELSQSGDTRQGGLLILDEENAVLGISLFRFDREPLASRLYGEFRIDRFRDLLRVDDTVLSETRYTLDERHVFCSTLAHEVERRLERAVETERKRVQEADAARMDSEEVKRYRRVFEALNDIAKQEIEPVVPLGPDPTDVLEPPPEGFCLYPSLAEITVGKKYSFELRMSRSRIKPGTKVTAGATSRSLEVTTPDFKVVADDFNDQGIARKFITVRGVDCDPSTELVAKGAGASSRARIAIVPGEELVIEGLVFQPASLTLRPGQPRSAKLLVYLKTVPIGTRIRLNCDNPDIHLSIEDTVVDGEHGADSIDTYEMEIWGEGVGESGLVSAESENGFLALLDVTVRAKEVAPPRGAGMFSEPEFDNDPEPLQRISYSAATGKVVIYTKFPTVRRYLGENGEYKNTVAWQVLLADMIITKCLGEIARKKVETGGVAVRPEGLADYIEAQANRLAREHGRKIHEVLVTREVLEKDRRDSQG